MLHYFLDKWHKKNFDQVSVPQIVGPDPSLGHDTSTLGRVII